MYTLVEEKTSRVVQSELRRRQGLEEMRPEPLPGRPPALLPGLQCGASSERTGSEGARGQGRAHVTCGSEMRGSRHGGRDAGAEEGSPAFLRAGVEPHTCADTSSDLSGGSKFMGAAWALAGGRGSFLGQDKVVGWQSCRGKGCSPVCGFPPTGGIKIKLST